MTAQDPYGDPTRVDVPVTDDPTQAMPAPVPGGPPPGGPPPPVDEPPRGPGGRGGWILAGLLALILLIGLVLLLLDDDDDDETATTDTTTTTLLEETTTSTTEATTSTTAAPTTSAPPSTVAPASCISGGPGDPESSVEVLYEAFTLRDRTCAEELATDEAVEALFAIPGEGDDWVFQGCEEQDLPDPHVDCAYTFPGGATHFRTTYSPVDGWVVYEVFQTAD
jgi:hypothetical protein